MKDTVMDETWTGFLRDLEQVRAVTPQCSPLELRAADDGDSEHLGVMEGHFSVFNRWYEIDSVWEGRFLERVAPGAFKRTFDHFRGSGGTTIKVLFNHGHDRIGDMVLGPIAELREDSVGGFYRVPLFDTSYNRDLLPGLKAGVYGSSFRFRVVQDQWNDEPGRSEHNPDGVPERTILESRVMEFGPVTFPANPDATAGVRSMTDRYYEQLRARDPQQYDQLLSRAREIRTPEPGPARQGTPVDGLASPAEDPPVMGHSEVNRRMQQRRRERLQARGLWTP